MFQPFGDNVLVKRAEKSTQAKVSALDRPDASQELPQEGHVVACGPKTTDDLRCGQHVFFAKYSGKPITLAGQEFIIMHEEEILGALTGEEQVHG